MRTILVILLAVTLLITACSNAVNNEEVENTNEETQEEQTSEGTDQEQIDEEQNSNENNVNEQNEEQEQNNDQQTEENQSDKNQNNEEAPNDTKEDTLLTEEEAIEKVRKHLGLENDHDVKIVVDNENNGIYLVHVFDVVMDNGVGHTATRGWYEVDRKSGEINSVF